MNMMPRHRYLPLVLLVDLALKCHTFSAVLTVSKNNFFSLYKSSCNRPFGAKIFDGDDDERRNSDYSDDEYEEYFKRRENRRLKNQDDILYKEYFRDIQEAYAKGTMPNITAPIYTEIDKGVGVTRNEFINLPLFILGATTIAAISQRQNFIKEFLSFKEIDHPLDIRTIRKPFSKEDIQVAISKAKQEGIASLPSLPSTLPTNIQYITGDATSLKNEISSERIVIYHFWRSSCHDSIATLMILESIADSNRDRITVISIHSPKYSAEDDILTATHAVSSNFQMKNTFQYIVQDKELTLWKSLGIDEWPAVLITVPNKQSNMQHVLFAIFGERATTSTFVADAISSIITSFNFKPFASGLKLIPALVQPIETELRDPWGIAVDSANDRLYISDSSNHRIIVCRLNGECVGVIGTGEAGLMDGRTQDAKFKFPRGIAIDKLNQVLWVCDTENDVIRRITLSENNSNFGLVKTIPVGGLSQSRSSESIAILNSNQIVDDLERTLKKEGYTLEGTDVLGYKRGLRSPWGIAMMDNFLYVTAAGSNQIWRLDTIGTTMTPIAGSGRYGHRDNPGRTRATLSDGVRFAQPMGIASSTGSLYIADSDSSSIRRINFLDKTISTQFGGDSVFSENLFHYGDRNGEGTRMKFQYPNGVAYLRPGQILCTDTYNHKVKLLLTPSEESRGEIFVGSGVRGSRDGSGGQAEFSYPSGIAVSADSKKAWVVDSGTGLIRTIDTNSKEVATLKLFGVPPPRKF